MFYVCVHPSVENLDTYHALVVCKLSENYFTGCAEVRLQVLWILHDKNFLFKLQLPVSSAVNTDLIITH